jgi:ATP-binding cassette subfamily B (MDR/TAP) protein 1
MLAQAISSTTLAVVLGLVLSWKLALVAISLQPCIIAAFYISTTTMQTMSKKILKAQNESNELASAAVVNHRIITAFCFQEKDLKLFELTQVSSKKESHRQSCYAGFGLFLSRFITGAIPALTFWYGGRLLYYKEITYKHLFLTFLILVTTGRLIAETGTITADLSKGTSALESVFRILKRRTKIDPEQSDGIEPEKINGEIEFKQVHFFYPNRPKQMILTGVNL